MNFLRPNHNVWRIERAARAAVLIDAAAFFEAVRGACLKAERSILVVGWDIDSRTQLVGADGQPPTACHQLRRLPERPGAGPARPARPSPAVGLLAALCRRARAAAAPVAGLAHARARDALLDDSVPFGTSQHQKIVVVDDAVAFSGGLDLTIRRWDTPAHGRQSASASIPRPSLPAVPRRPDDGRRRGGAGAGAAGARALVPRQRRRCRRSSRMAIPGRRRCARISPTSMSASPAPSRATTARTRCARSRRCSSIRSIWPSARSTSRTSS